MEASAEHDFVLFGSSEFFAQRIEKDTRADSEAYATYTNSNTLSLLFYKFSIWINTMNSLIHILEYITLKFNIFFYFL